MAVHLHGNDILVMYGFQEDKILVSVVSNKAYGEYPGGQSPPCYAAVSQGAFHAPLSSVRIAHAQFSVRRPVHRSRIAEKRSVGRALPDNLFHFQFRRTLWWERPPGRDQAWSHSGLWL